jgi:capsular polysaccharide export protein
MNKLKPKNFCFLQGPVSPFFKLLAKKLNSCGFKTYKINLCLGDWIFGISYEQVNYRGRLEEWADFIRGFYIKYNISYVLMTGEQRQYHIIANNIARELGIPIVVTDLGYFRPDWISFELNGMSGDSLFPKDKDEIIQLSKLLPSVSWEKKYADSFFYQSLYEIIYCFSSIGPFRLLYPFYKPYPRYHPIKMFLGTGLHLLKTAWRKKSTNKRILLLTGSEYYFFPLQMQFDYQILAYSKYESMRDAIQEVIISFAQNACKNSKLVIKEHPLDENITNWRNICLGLAKKEGVDGRVLYFDGGDLDFIIKNSLGIITINSTVGLTSLMHGKATYVLGEAIYKIDELTCHISLDKFWNAPIAPNLKLRDAFIKLLAHSVQIRGTYHCKEGLKSAVEAAALRLIYDKVNQFS